MATEAEVLYELFKIHNELHEEYGALKYPCWEGVAAHNEDKVEQLMILIDALETKMIDRHRQTGVPDL